jgi:hypothetical protein
LGPDWFQIYIVIDYAVTQGQEFLGFKARLKACTIKHSKELISNRLKKLHFATGPVSRRYRMSMWLEMGPQEGATTFSITTLSITTFCIIDLIVTLSIYDSIMTLGVSIECHYDECRYAECRF